MRISFTGLLIICLVSVLYGQAVKISASNPLIIYHGRSALQNNGIALISSASFAELRFSGDSCLLGLSSIAPAGDYNYVAIELDDQYEGRLKITKAQPMDYAIVSTKKSNWHLLRVYKATEAQNGLVVINYIKALKVQRVAAPPRKKVEFIGNSITCGFGSDFKEIPCSSSVKWYDQHNAYWSYASRIARSLGVDFTLSAISGAGIYRNWNSEGPTVPQQYELTYLRFDSLKKWNFSNYVPDMVLIALGTNDLSDGDGKTPRTSFDSSIFVSTYIKFIKSIYNHYPGAQIVLLTSPMLIGAKAQKLLSCLQAVRLSVTELNVSLRKIKVFEFKPMHATGCQGHPSMQEHEELSNELLPFMKQVLKGL
jgi:lysophospholipase L1-like esterase